MIGVAAAACWIVGWREISTRGIIAVAAIVMVYFWVRFVVLDIPAPSIDERATGWWLTELDRGELAARSGANRFPLYAYNLMAALVGLLVSEPRDGTW